MTTSVSRSRTSAARSRGVAVAVTLVMTSIAVPSALRYRTVNVSSGNGTWRLDVELTELWRIDAFVWTYNWTQSLLRSIIPVVIYPVHTADADATQLASTVELSRVGGVYMNSQLAHDDCRRVRSHRRHDATRLFRLVETVAN